MKMTMWYYKWLLFLMCVMYVNVEAVAVDNKKFVNNRHKHLLLPASSNNQHYRSSNKLRHHGSNGFNDHDQAKTKRLPKMDKFMKLDALNKRLEERRVPAKKTTATSTTTRTPYFFDQRTKSHHQHHNQQLAGKHQEVHRAEPEAIEDFNDDYDEEEDSYVDEPVARVITTSTTTTTTEAPDDAEEDDLTDNEQANDDYYDDEVFEERTRNYTPQADVQAEDSGSPMLLYKWNNYGNRGAMDEIANKNHGNANGRMQSAVGTTDVHASTKSAIRHIMRMKSQARCRLPRPRVINVQDLHPSPGKGFRPHCTVLHRCGDDTGCCQDPEKKCRARTQELIYLYFYVYSTTYGQHQRVERLSFYNHTECDCMNENEMNNLQSVVRTRGNYKTLLDRENSLPYEQPPSCKCPEEFVPTISHRYVSRRGSHCICDCPPNSDPLSGCISMKRGEEHLSLRDRTCILEEKCGVPACEYDAYMKSKGRCPRKQEKMGSYGLVFSTNRHSESDNDDDDDDSLEDF